MSRRSSEHLRATTRGSFDAQEALGSEPVMEVRDDEITLDPDKTYTPS